MADATALSGLFAPPLSQNRTGASMRLIGTGRDQSADCTPIIRQARREGRTDLIVCRT